METRVPQIPLSSIDDEIAREKARLLAAKALAEHRDQRERVEAVYGTEYTRRRYPEAYAAPSRIGGLLDRLKGLLG